MQIKGNVRLLHNMEANKPYCIHRQVDALIIKVSMGCPRESTTPTPFQSRVTPLLRQE